MIENFQWEVSKPDVRIFFPHRFVEGRGKGSGFLISPVVINTLIGFKVVPQVHCDWLQVNHINVFLLSFVKCIFRSGRGIYL